MDRPLVCIDIESTGVNPATDRIIELAIVSEEFELGFLVNPGIPIPSQATEVHGIGDADVVDWKPFSEYAEAIYAVVRAADIIGFNCSNFDVPILWEELYGLASSGIFPSYECSTPALCSKSESSGRLRLRCGSIWAWSTTATTQ